MKNLTEGLKALTTDEELQEVQAIRHGVKHLKLQYLKGSKEKMAWAAKYGQLDGRMWNLLEPKLPGYTYDGGFPTFTLTGLKERGLI